MHALLIFVDAFFLVVLLLPALENKRWKLVLVALFGLGVSAFAKTFLYTEYAEADTLLRLLRAVLSIGIALLVAYTALFLKEFFLRWLGR